LPDPLPICRVIVTGPQFLIRQRGHRGHVGYGRQFKESAIGESKPNDFSRYGRVTNRGEMLLGLGNRKQLHGEKCGIERTAFQGLWIAAREPISPTPSDKGTARAWGNWNDEDWLCVGNTA